MECFATSTSRLYIWMIFSSQVRMLPPTSLAIWCLPRASSHCQRELKTCYSSPTCNFFEYPPCPRRLEDAFYYVVFRSGRGLPRCEECLGILCPIKNPFSATQLTVDASDVAVGAELSERDKAREWSPLAFFSHSLSLAERKYSTFDRELLAIFLAVKHFRQHLEGRKFYIQTDHKPLTYALTSATDLSLIHI